MIDEKENIERLCRLATDAIERCMIDGKGFDEALELNDQYVDAVKAMVDKNPNISNEKLSRAVQKTNSRLHHELDEL